MAVLHCKSARSSGVDRRRKCLSRLQSEGSRDDAERHIERTIAWLNRCRRLAKDWERLNHNALAFLQWASVRLMMRKLCRNSK